MRRESCFISPGGWDLLPPRTGAWGGVPKKLTLRIPGFLGISASHRQPSPLLPFPQGLGSHHSGLRTIKGWEPGGSTSPKCTPSRHLSDRRDQELLGHLEAYSSPIDTGWSRLASQELAQRSWGTHQRLQGPGSDRGSPGPGP